jgi:tripartite-type tricarboxylate transporter receptor subunit TctC
MAAFTHAVNAFLYRSIGYDPVANFEPLTLLSHQPSVMIVPNSSPVHWVVEFISYSKANHARSATLRPATELHRISAASCSNA